MHEAEKALFEAMKLYTHLGDGYYRDRVQRGSALENYEKAIFQYSIENWNPHATRVIEAGAGWGTLCLMLAVHGFEVWGYTGESIYFNTFRKLSDHLAREYPHIQSNLHTIEGYFPYAMRAIPQCDRPFNVLCSTNVIHSFTESSQDAFLASALQFDRYIIDVATFGRERNDQEQKELRGLLANGFEIQKELSGRRLLLMRPIDADNRHGEVKPTPGWLLGAPAPISNLSELDHQIVPVSDHSWQIRLPSALDSLCDSAEFPVRSPWRLLENGRLLGPPHSLHADIAEQGLGRYSHWHDHLIFSSSDNSSPAVNGQSYTLVRSLFG